MFTEQERAQLAAISAVVRFRRGEKIYEQGDRADFVFNIISGVVKSYKFLPDAGEFIIGFLFPDDVFGLAEEVSYINSAEAVTAVTGYRIPTTVLKTTLLRDPSLEFHILCKLCHELRESQRHSLLLSTHRALPKIARFLLMLDTNQAARRETTEEVHLPMSQSEIGDYIGISPEAVGRSFRNLASQEGISIRHRRYVRIINRVQLERTASESRTPGLLPSRRGTGPTFRELPLMPHATIIRPVGRASGPSWEEAVTSEPRLLKPNKIQGIFISENARCTGNSYFTDISGSR